MNPVSDVVVVGGGSIGCAVSYYAARRGLRVTLIDQPKRGRATSASAGGTWPLGESLGLGCGIIYYKTLLAKGLIPEGEFGPESLPQCFIDFALRSNAMFPRLAEELKQWGGLDMEFEKTSLLFVMYDDIDVAFANALLAKFPREKSLMEWLSTDELAKCEPAITPNNRGALRFTSDHQVSPYRFADALRAGARSRGATTVTHTEVAGLHVKGGRVLGVETREGYYPAGAVVNAAGAWASIVGSMAGLEIPVQPVRGQIVGTETLPEVLNACISTSDCYIAQKQHGEIIIGSTTEEVGFETGNTPEAMQYLAAGAIRALPFLENVAVKRVWSGFRPGSPDELPILGPVDGLAGYFNACGHFRTGILNAPLTGQIIAELLIGEKPSFPIQPFLMSRFDKSKILVQV